MNYEGFTEHLDTCERDFRHEVTDLSSSLLLHDSANIEVFNLANKGRPETIYLFDEVTGCKFTTSNHRSKLLSSPITLFNIDIKNSNFYL